MSNKLYFGMQFGNIGYGNSVTATIVSIRELADDEVPIRHPGLKLAEGCDVVVEDNKISGTDISSNNDVWNSKLIFDPEFDLEKDETYTFTFSLESNGTGVGEFFLLKSENIDDRYDETFTDGAGEKTVTFTAEGGKVYIGMQFGNIGKGNTVTATIGEINKGVGTGKIPGLILSDNCTVNISGRRITATDNGTNNDVWNSKILYDPGISLVKGQKYEVTFSLSGAHGVGEFFLCKSANIDSRYDESFTDTAGQKTVTFTAAGNRLYVGMQFGNVGTGNSVTANIISVQQITSTDPSSIPGLKQAENCTVKVNGKTITATDNSANNDVWNSKLLYDAGLTLEKGKEYKITFSLSGEHGVGEFFLCKSQNLDDRYDETFTNATGQKTIIFTATGTKAYVGMQFGNIGRGNSVSATIVKLVRADQDTEQPQEGFINLTTENCTATVNGKTVKVTDTDDNNDVWNSKALYDANVTLEAGKKYQVTFTLTGEHGVGEFFLCKSANIDHRYDESFTNEAGEKTVTITADSSKLYFGIQCGNIGKGNSVSVTIGKITPVTEEEQPTPTGAFTLVQKENCDAVMDDQTVTLTDTSSNNDVWNSKALYDANVTLEAGKKYQVTFTLTGEHGVGEFFLCKSDNIDHRYDESFTNTAGERTVTITADGAKLYFGIQCGNIGKGNSVSVTIGQITPVTEEEEPTPTGAFTELQKENCDAVMDGNTVTLTDTDDNNDVWNSKALYDTNVALEAGKKYEVTFTLTGEHGVGEFFLCKSDNIDHRYDESFTNEAGEKTVTITADGSKLYFGIQCGNIGKGNSVSVTIGQITPVTEEEVPTPAGAFAELLKENCDAAMVGKTVTLTDTNDNNDVWNSKALYDANVTLEAGKKYEVTFTLTGEHGVGEFFLCKSANIDHRYDESFTNTAGERTVTITADGSKLYFGIQCGNIGNGNTVSVTIGQITQVTEEEPTPAGAFAELLKENCDAAMVGKTVTLTDTSDNNDVWNSKVLYDAGVSLESSMKYAVTFTLTGENGVGEFFLCKSANIDHRYDESFTNTAGEKTVTITADGSKLYFGVQCGNIGKGNTVSVTLNQVTPVTEEFE